MNHVVVNQYFQLSTIPTVRVKESLRQETVVSWAKARIAIDFSGES